MRLKEGGAVSINNKPIVILVYLQHVNVFFFQFGKWNCWNLQKCYLKINHRDRQQAGGCQGQGKGGDCLMYKVSFMMMGMFWNKIRAVIAPSCRDTNAMELFALQWAVLCEIN